MIEGEDSSNSILVTDYAMFKDLLESIFVGHSHRLQRVESIPSLIHFFSCVNGLLSCSPPSEERSKIYTFILQMAVTTLQNRNNWDHRMCDHDWRMVMIYLGSMLFKEMLPVLYVTEGAEASMTARIILGSRNLYRQHYHSIQ